MKNPFRDDDAQLKKLASEIERLTREVAALRAEKKAITETRDLEDKIIGLKKQVTELEIVKDKKQEEFDRRERELTHMIGLEKKRQEIETKQAKQEATLAVREENLKAERTEFDKQMKFREERFDGEVKYLKDLMEKILGRLPTVSVDRQIEETVRSRR